jgi:hypothetical protein
MRRLIAGLLLAALPLFTAAQPAKQAPRLEEAKVAAKAFRQMASRVDSGVGYRDYSQSVSELKFAVDELYTELARRKIVSERTALRLAFEPYQDAKDLWGECVSSGECSDGVIVMDPRQYPIAGLVLDLLKRYPALDRPVDDGGVKAATGHVRWRVMLGRLWAVGAERANALNLPR